MSSGIDSIQNCVNLCVLSTILINIILSNFLKAYPLLDFFSSSLIIFLKVVKILYLGILYIYIYIYIFVGAKAWTFVLGLKPHLLKEMHPRRSKWLERLQSEWSCKERVKGISPRRSFSSDLTNVSQVGIRWTWVTFQEIPAMKINFRCVRRW